MIGWRTPLLVATVVVQLAVPVAWIAGQARVLAQGSVWRVRTAPVDPYDPFRGRYVALDFPLQRLDGPVPEVVRTHDRVWGVLGTDDDGFARFERFTVDAPDVPALPVRVTSATEDAAFLELPFDRYYLPEDVAPRVEALVRETRWTEPGETPRDAWLTVRVLDGHAAVDDLVIDGRSFRDVLADPTSRGVGAPGGP